MDPPSPTDMALLLEDENLDAGWAAQRMSTRVPKLRFPPTFLFSIFFFHFSPSAPLKSRLWVYKLCSSRELPKYYPFNHLREKSR